MRAAKNNSKEIFLTRIYDAPVKTVWDAWCDPKQAAQWWGPRGFTITTHSKDLKPGGHWDYTMHGPDGTDWPNVTIYHEVKEYSRLVYDHGGNKTQPPLFRVTVDFIDLKGKTQINMSMGFASPEKAAESRKFIKAAGGTGTWDRLAEYLEEKSTKKDVFVINRSFEAPIEKMFQVWTDPNHFSQWLPPTGFTMKFIKADIREGGKTFYSMTSLDGAMTMYGRASYLKIRKPDLLQYTQQFCDAQENISRHPMAPTWPETMLTTVRFIKEDENNTLVNITWEVYGEATAEERAMFHSAKGGMTQGWTGSFEKLEAYLTK